MGFREDVEAESHTGGRQSYVDQHLDALNDKDAAELRDVLMDFRISDGAIGRALAKRGVNISDGAIGNWRRKHRRGAG